MLAHLDGPFLVLNMISHIEFLVEEPSMEAALRLIVPKIVGDLSFEVYPYQCKQDFLQKLPARIRGYAAWLPPDWRVVIILDRDDDTCLDLKQQLEIMVFGAGLRTRSQAAGGPFQVINRLAIEELEAWFFGDWEAVRIAYPNVSNSIPAKKGYRDPDVIAGGTWEALERTLRRAGYFRSGLRKIEAARKIAERMDPNRNRSNSFRAFRNALAEMVDTRMLRSEAADVI
jgi:hypothetical protein